ncbi:putative endonuclease/exonuclease/phosphatase [Rosa chinensis]|uniref:Putative endonuclease/exonuclease/phosphatase n=1 Tax=Rosa chinensis TaxID=74649 RepID=A0A2P6S379_ROSCH|nr:putative endonuclease/exonuclease/phosphatase [Rosa chinensis]
MVFDVLCLVDTMIDEDTAKNLVTKLPFCNYFCVPPVGHSGGLLLLWNSNYSISILSSHPKFIHCKFQDVCSTTPWLVTFLYMFPHKHQQQDLWNELVNLQVHSQEPWFIMGDFNCILHLKEKRGGSNFVDRYIIQFRP